MKEEDSKKSDGLSNIVFEEFERYGIEHGQERKSNDVDWLDSMKASMKISQSSDEQPAHVPSAQAIREEYSLFQ